MKLSLQCLYLIYIVIYFVKIVITWGDKFRLSQNISLKLNNTKFKYKVLPHSINVPRLSWYFTIFFSLRKEKSHKFILPALVVAVANEQKSILSLKFEKNFKVRIIKEVLRWFLDVISMDTFLNIYID